jgi:NAD-dependent DNA ligase
MPGPSATALSREQGSGPLAAMAILAPFLFLVARLELLLHTVGGNAPAHGEASMSTELPFTKPPPTIDFVDRAFCFTGKFFSGTRSWCEEQVASRGAHCCAITRDLDYLVIGEIGSRDWIHSTHGRKIEKAIEDNGRGCCIGIVSEQYWHGFL